MLATLPQTPVTITSRWVLPWTPPCARYPQGATGILEISSPTKRKMVTAQYRVECVLDGGKIVGWELTSLANDQVYHLDPYSWGWDQAECSCGDCTFRSRMCKHARALFQAMKEIGQ